MVSRKVRWRAWTSCLAPVRTDKRCSSRMSKVGSGNSRVRAAASSSASGSPSSRRQISTTVRALSSLNWNCGLTACARCTNSATEATCASASCGGKCSLSGSASGGTANSYSPSTRSTARLVTSSLSCGQAGELGRRREHLLEVVQQQHELLIVQEGFEALARQPLPTLVQAQRVGNGQYDLLGVADGRE